MDNTDAGMLGAVGGFLGGMIISAFFILPAAIDDVEKDWCQEKGGKYIDHKCFEEYKEIKLK